MNILKIIKYILVWRTLLFLAIIPAMLLLPLKDGFTNLTSTNNPANLLTVWSNFDGRHYLNLAAFGYDKPITHQLYAFFPVYPWLINHIDFIHSPLITALLISHISLVFALWLLYRLTRLDYGKQIARNTVFLLLLFPTSFFLGAVYTESFFLLLSVAVFYCLRTKRFVLASILATIAGATRIYGILLWLVILIELWETNRHQLRKFIDNSHLPWTLLPPLGLFLYMHYQRLSTGSYFTFLTDQPGLSINHFVNKIILLYQVFYRYLRMLIFINHDDPLFFRVLLEFTTGALLLLLTFFIVKKLRPSYGFYAISAYILPTFTGTFSSLPRYALIIFPAFIMLSIWFSKQPKCIKLIYIVTNLIFLSLTVSLFSRGYFVS